MKGSASFHFICVQHDHVRQGRSQKPHTLPVHMLSMHVVTECQVNAVNRLHVDGATAAVQLVHVRCVGARALTVGMQPSDAAEKRLPDQVCIDDGCS